MQYQHPELDLIRQGIEPAQPAIAETAGILNN
jgi:hypothetical protein